MLKILVRSPILLSYSMESLRGKQSYFEEGLQLDAKDVRRVTTVPTPEIRSNTVCHSFSCGTLLWWPAWERSFTVNNKSNGWRTVLETKRTVLTLLVPVAQTKPRPHITSWSCIRAPGQVSSFISRCPQVLGYGVDAMESKLVFLMQVRASCSTAGTRLVSSFVAYVPHPQSD